MLKKIIILVSFLSFFSWNCAVQSASPVSAEITKIEKHADSDHLQICKVDCGKYGNDIQIVTGADNIFEGAIVPAALDGSTLPNGITFPFVFKIIK